MNEARAGGWSDRRGARWLGLALGLAAACGGVPTAPAPPPPGPPPSAARFRILACRGSDEAPQGEIFRVEVTDPTVVAEADALLGRGNVKILYGRLAAGDGGVNPPWSWHFDPASVSFVDVAMEACDGCPGEVEANLGYWFSLGIYCPWTAEVVARER